MPGVRVIITNTLPKKVETPKVDDDLSTHMMFNRSTIEELSQEDSLEYGDDGGLSDDPIPSESLLEEERIPNGGHSTHS